MQCETYMIRFQNIYVSCSKHICFESKSRQVWNICVKVHSDECCVFGIELVIRSAGSVIEYIYSCIKIICLTGTYICCIFAVQENEKYNN